jgi:hypothetical protein
MRRCTDAKQYRRVSRSRIFALSDPFAYLKAEASAGAARGSEETVRERRSRWVLRGRYLLAMAGLQAGPDLGSVRGLFLRDWHL